MPGYTMPGYVDQLRKTIHLEAERLRAISDNDAARRPASDKWSPKEILGHLIDSAVNNHLRFVTGQLKSDLVFSGYAHEDWVRLQAYQSASWQELITLWELYNRRLADVMESVPEDVRSAPQTNHNLHEISWKKLPRAEPATLDYLMNDYVGHMKHHLGQIL